MGPIDRTSGGFDVIGDIHGCHSHLVELLHALGYRDDRGYFHHPQRQVIFVGDLIDRGPEQVAVIDTVRAMHKAGTAHVVMGNHEFNAVCYATRGPDGDWLRKRNERNLHQHREFLDQIVADSDDHSSTIDWFKTLPLWLKEGELRVVHACWDQDAINGLESPYLDDSAFIAASDRESDHYRWVEHLCKGPEVELPEGYHFEDKDGHIRKNARYRWWIDGDGTYETMCEVPSSHALPKERIPNKPVQPYTDDTPVIFGHYWREWPNAELSTNTVCVDHSAVKNGHLVAYRWNHGDSELHPHNLVGVTR